MNTLILISVSGELPLSSAFEVSSEIVSKVVSKVTAQLTRSLSDYPADILDIEQSVIHNQLSLGILVRLPTESEAGLVAPNLEQMYQTLASSLATFDVSITCSPISEHDYHIWVTQEGKPKWILTLLARQIRAQHLAEISNLIASAGLGIGQIQRLSGQVPLDSQEDITDSQCVEFSLFGEVEASFREELLELCSSLNIDIAVQPDNLCRLAPRLIVFDMDSTLIKIEVIDELAVLAGAGAEVKSITDQAMSNHLDFKESLQQRVALLRGLPETAMAQVAATLPLMDGAESLFRTLNHLGYKTAILSGGFEYFGEKLQQRLGIDYMFANRLEIAEGKLTGKVMPPILDAQRKVELLRELADREKITLQQTIAVGDGANDLAMLDAAGLGIAFHAKPIVRESAMHAISNHALDSLLYLMGIKHRDIKH